MRASARLVEARHVSSGVGAADEEHGARTGQRCEKRRRNVEDLARQLARGRHDERAHLGTVTWQRRA
jgi:hypothetical protein